MVVAQASKAAHSFRLLTAGAEPVAASSVVASRLVSAVALNAVVAADLGASVPSAAAAK